jgi:hypothetical protein
MPVQNLNGNWVKSLVTQAFIAVFRIGIWHPDPDLDPVDPFLFVLLDPERNSELHTRGPGSVRKIRTLNIPSKFQGDYRLSFIFCIFMI